MNRACLPPDFVDQFLLPYLTELLDAELEDAADIYKFSARYFEIKVREKDGRAHLAKERYASQKKTDKNMMNSRVPKFSHNNEMKFLLKDPKTPHRLKDLPQKKITVSSTPNLERITVFDPKRNNEYHSARGLLLEQKESETFESIKEFSCLLPDYISVMIDLMENLTKETETGQHLGKKVSANKEVLGKLQDSNEISSQRIIPNKTASTQTHIDNLESFGTSERQTDKKVLTNPFIISQSINPDETDHGNLISEKEMGELQLVVQDRQTSNREILNLKGMYDKNDVRKDPSIKLQDNMNLTLNPIIPLIDNDPVNTQTMTLDPETKVGGSQPVASGKKHGICETCTCKTAEGNLLFDSKQADTLSSMIFQGRKSPEMKLGDIANSDLINFIEDYDEGIDSQKISDTFTVHENTERNFKDFEAEVKFETNGFVKDKSKTVPTGEELKYIYDCKPDIPDTRHEEFSKTALELQLGAVNSDDSKKRNKNIPSSEIPESTLKNSSEENFREYWTLDDLFNPKQVSNSDLGTPKVSFKHPIEVNIPYCGTPNGINIPDCKTSKNLSENPLENNIPDCGTLNDLYNCPIEDKIPDSGSTKNLFQNQTSVEDIKNENIEMNIPIEKCQTIYKETERLKEQLQQSITAPNTLQDPCQQLKNNEDIAKDNGQETQFQPINENVVPITGKNWLRTYFTVQKIKGVSEDDWKSSYVAGQNDDLGPPVWTLHSERTSPFKIFKKDGFYKGFRTWYFARRLRAIEKNDQEK